jgi:hypothetical protein
MATAEEILEKAKKEAAARAGKTTAERLAEMKAEREKKLAEQAANRPTAKQAAATKAAETEKANNLKFYEETQKRFPDKMGIVGSSVTKFLIDPKTGKKRSAKEIVDAVTEAVLADKTAPTGISIDPITGKQRQYTPAQKINAALSQLMSAAEYEKDGLGIADEVYKYLQKGARGMTVSSLANKPENWEINKDSVGKIIDRKYFDEPGSRKVFILDPTKNQLTPEQLKQYKDAGAMPLDPVTGFQVLIDDQGRYTLGDQPTPQGDTSTMDYSKYIPGVNEKAYGMTPVSNIGSQSNVDPVTGLSFSNDAFVEGMGNDMSDGMVSSNATNTSNTTNTGNTTNTSNISNANAPGNIYAPQNSERKSAYDLLYAEFKQYGLESLVEDLKSYITSGISRDEFIIKLRASKAYQARFPGNAERLKKGLAAINEATYIGLEDQYQNIMRNYGLPESYWKKNDQGLQEGFTNLIGNDVSAPELEDRIMNAQNRVIKANPEVTTALKQFYPEISNADILAYTLDPTKGLEDIKRKITAAEIGGAALQSGLQTNLSRAEELRKYGITKDAAQQGYGAIGNSLMRGSQLASIYGEDPYTQATAEQEVFKIPGAEEARKQRQKITGLERATFSGQTGLTSGALARDRAGGY